MATTRGPAAGVVTALIVTLVGCSDGLGRAHGSPSRASTSATSPRESDPTSTGATRAAAGPVRTTAAPPATTRGRKRVRHAPGISVTIPSIGVRNLRVVPYTGHADDLPGTRIQNRGLAATPRGPKGGVGPGQIGNMLITAHRTTAGGPFRRLPSVRNGAHILIASGGLVYDYAVTGTMTISFRSARSIARQSAPVPGYPGQRATRAMITLSTCATPEDHARGNYWADALGNPEHRIDKVGVLVAVRTA